MGYSEAFKWFMGGKAHGIGYEDNQSPTLSVSDSHVPAVVSIQGDGTSSNGSQNGCGYNDDGSAYTLNGRDRQSVAFTQNKRDEVRLEGL